MSQTKYLKCECQHCGNHLEFPADAIGMAVDCPHCRQQTELTLSTPPELSAPAPKNMTWIIAGIVILLIGVIATVASFVVLNRLAKRNQRHTPVAVTKEPGTKRVSPAMPANGTGQISTNNFSVSQIVLEKAKGSALVYAVGTVKNDSPQQRFGIKVELDLFDADGLKVGAASDYQQILEPKAEWRFKALVLDPKAASATLASIKEDL
jgi:hypothetical protein